MSYYDNPLPGRRYIRRKTGISGFRFLWALPLLPPHAFSEQSGKYSGPLSISWILAPPSALRPKPSGPDTWMAESAPKEWASLGNLVIQGLENGVGQAAKPAAWAASSLLRRQQGTRPSHLIAGYSDYPSKSWTPASHCH